MKDKEISMTKEEILKSMKNTQFQEDPENVRVHAEICNKLHEIYMAKNADYGDSFARVRKKYPWYPNVILIQLDDKLNRLDTLMKESDTLTKGSEQHVHDESIDDTLLDMANYCIMELVERKLEGKTCK